VIKGNSTSSGEIVARLALYLSTSELRGFFYVRYLSHCDSFSLGKDI
jgi:hypothetical protein